MVLKLAMTLCSICQLVLQGDVEMIKLTMRVEWYNVRGLDGEAVSPSSTKNFELKADNSAFFRACSPGGARRKKKIPIWTIFSTNFGV